MTPIATADGTQEYVMTTTRKITRRGVMWLGQTCNLRCHFCYFIDRIIAKDHPEHPFMSLDKAKRLTSTLVDFYGNNAIDIQGGEPTIYPHITELLTHCREIGLLPTLITNGIVLSRLDICKRFQDAGIRDYLFSIHGIGDTYDEIVGMKGGHKRQMQALRNLVEVGTPIRFNCVLSKKVLPDLDAIAQVAVDHNVRAVNFLTFNPFADQRNGHRSTYNVPRYSEVAAALTPALDRLDAAGIEGNVRYLPICMLEERHRKSGYNYQQLSYDIHEWDYASWSWTLLQPQRMKEGELTPPTTLQERLYDMSVTAYGGVMKMAVNAAKATVARFPDLKAPMRRLHRKVRGYVTPGRSPIEEMYRQEGMNRARHEQYKYGEKCQQCALKGICDGFHNDYVEMFGTDEARPVTAPSPVTDPKYYISSQKKIVAKEDYNWAI